MEHDSGKNHKLRRECDVFCRYLTGQGPDEYVHKKYQDAHAKGGAELHTTSAFDLLLINAASINPLVTKFVDVYTAIFLKHAVFRKKLILLLAILESCMPWCDYFDSVTSSSRPIIFIRLFSSVLVFVVSLGLSVIIFSPLHLIFRKA